MASVLRTCLYASALKTEPLSETSLQDHGFTILRVFEEPHSDLPDDAPPGSWNHEDNVTSQKVAERAGFYRRHSTLSTSLDQNYLWYECQRVS